MRVCEHFPTDQEKAVGLHADVNAAFEVFCVDEM